MRHLFSLLILSGVSVVLSGCAEHIAEREGAEIQVVPVTYSIGITIKKDKQDKARQELDNYVQSHWLKVTTQKVNLVWYTKPGKALADHYYQYLLEQGVNKDKVTLNKAMDTTGKVPFDMKFQTMVYRSVVEVCDYEKIGNFGQTNIGCYTDSARWQSMVYPENMLNTGYMGDSEKNQPDTE
ncbi:hypothetical protein DI392_02930 [Vibrio albus]|uniref:Lipoprotein n=1 Tax=Vibrio albus TaxID=2200953 RepID=A0A2U3BEM5_9VIBR|nr:hypothetical protein [Vibrio albus]PWI35237.1 hypothetical protein DI392_02930 [Vibrio albus]